MNLRTVKLIIIYISTLLVFSCMAKDKNIKILIYPSNKMGIYKQGVALKVYISGIDKAKVVIEDIDAHEEWRYKGNLSAGCKLPDLPVGWYVLKVKSPDNNTVLTSRAIAVIPKIKVSEDSAMGIMNPFKMQVHKQIGVKWLRLPIVWNKIEKEKGKYDWSCDIHIKQAGKEGINIIGMIAFCPKWASSAPEKKRFMIYPPKNAQDFGDFVFKVVSKYKGQIKYWELWNEPDVLGHFWGGTYDQFGKVLKAGYLAAKKADPSCRVIFGGLSWASTKLLRTVLEGGYGKYFDIMADHPYSTSAWIYALKNNPDYEVHLKRWQKKFNTPFPYHSTFTRADNIRKVLKKYGFEKPLWATETGATTGKKWPFVAPTRVSFREQAGYIFKSFIEAFAAGHRKVVLYQFTCKKNPDDIENFGIFNYNLTPRPSLVTYAVIADNLKDVKSGKKIFPPLKPGNNGDVSRINVFSMEVPDGNIYAAWCNTRKEAEVKFKTSGKKLTLTDAFGRKIIISCPLGTGKLKLGQTPFLISTPGKKKISFSK